MSATPHLPVPHTLDDPAPMTLPRLAEKKRAGEPIVMITAYDYPSAQVAQQAGVDLVLVGDSGAMTVLGYHSTVPVSVDEMLMQPFLGDVSKTVKKLTDACIPTRSSKDKGKPLPKGVRFGWGNFSFEGYIEKVSAKYTLFRPDGTPIRASCTIAMRELPHDAPSQNPTSGSLHALGSHQVVEGDAALAIGRSSIAHGGDFGVGLGNADPGFHRVQCPASRAQHFPGFFIRRYPKVPC